MPASALRVLRDHWPALLALMLAAELARYAGLELAGFVGAMSSIGGILLMPLPTLARILGYVAMFLVVRNSLRTLQELAPAPNDSRERRRAFVDGLLGGILPFIAVYALTNLLRDDFLAYVDRALYWRSAWLLERIIDTEAPELSDDFGDKLPFNAITVGIVLAAFAGRWAWKRYRERLPRWTAGAAIYLEALWTLLTVTFIGDLLNTARAWIDSRVGAQWLSDAGDWVAERAAPVAWLYESLGRVLGEVAGLVVLPMAWLTIAGVIYGQAVAAQAPQFTASGWTARAQARYARLPEALRKRIPDFGGRIVSIWRAFILMWRAGPLIICIYVLLFTVVDGLGNVLAFSSTRLIGPQSIEQWTALLPALGICVAAVAESLRVAVVAASYDETLLSAEHREVEAQRGVTSKRTPSDSPAAE